jgi:hypothetical protein
LRPKDPLAAELVVYLNELLTADREALSELLNIKIKCNDLLENHPTLLTEKEKNDTYVTVLGILNGFLKNKKVARKILGTQTISFCLKDNPEE